MDVDLNSYSENAKMANIKPIFKEDEGTKVKHKCFSIKCILWK